MQIEILTRIDIHLFSIAICLLMLVDTQNQYLRGQNSFRLFRLLLLGCMTLLAMESVSWALDGRGSQSEVFLFNSVFFALQPLPAFFWSLYVDWQIDRSKEKLRRHLRWLLLPIFVVECILLSNLLCPFVFSVDTAGYYQREPGFFPVMALGYSYLGYTLLRVWKERFWLEAATLRPLVLFHLPPLVGGIVQGYLYGTSLVWPGMTFSLLIIYVYIQNCRLSADHLTGAFNRMQVDQQLRRRIRNAARHAFSAILLDVDRFKEINDKYGHTTGDEILVITVALLRESLRKDDFLARYGGDEFIIIVETKDRSDLDRIIHRIRYKFDAFNHCERIPFPIHLSMGYDMYEPMRKMTEKQFLHHIDVKMYEEKRKNHRKW